MKTTNIIKIREQERDELIKDINNVKDAIDMAHQNFNMVSDASEVDVYIYRLREAEARYDSLIKKLREL